MSLNIIAYGIYGIISVLITVFVGKAFHRNGCYYVSSIFEDQEIAKSVNNTLLIGYYLTNIGFAIYKISEWQLLKNTKELVEQLSISLSLIFILLGM